MGATMSKVNTNISMLGSELIEWINSDNLSALLSSPEGKTPHFYFNSSKREKIYKNFEIYSKKQKIYESTDKTLKQMRKAKPYTLWQVSFQLSFCFMENYYTSKQADPQLKF